MHSPDLKEMSECNCSICAMEGFIGLIIKADALKSLEGNEYLQEYTFNTGTAKHWFCKTCGISPLTVPRSFPEGYNINYRCLQRDNVRSATITSMDGQNWEEAMAAGKFGKH
ncbi:hypothetical protein ABVK25_009088 [Lepraria finkii]|uniref:CENP-V/GFA domain-containing protein n=1 Tax=Lepraria finkii TaxID=1340010 RepID=A0ABR4AZ50_9LECA